MRLWNSLYFKPGRYAPDHSHSLQWNRGAYLTEALGHCGACHTPHNALMAEIRESAYEGGSMEETLADGTTRHWSAVALAPISSDLKAWSEDDLVQYLGTGYCRRAGVFGPMNEVIANSLRHLTPEDLRAMAVYSRSFASRAAADSAGRQAPNTTIDNPAADATGGKIYAARCAHCHQASGKGGLFSGPPLAGSAVVQTADPASLLNIILHGPQVPEQIVLGSWESMSEYGSVLTDVEVASVANYIRSSWGNAAPLVTAADVTQQR
jgi:mono/diheme cytochrome c family protein